MEYDENSLMTTSISDFQKINFKDVEEVFLGWNTGNNKDVSHLSQETFFRDALWFTRPKQRVESAKPFGAVQPSVLMNASMLQTTLLSRSPSTSTLSMSVHGYCNKKSCVIVRTVRSVPHSLSEDSINGHNLLSRNPSTLTVQTAVGTHAFYPPRRALPPGKSFPRSFSSPDSPASLAIPELAPIRSLPRSQSAQTGWASELTARPPSRAQSNDASHLISAVLDAPINSVTLKRHQVRVVVYSKL